MHENVFNEAPGLMEGVACHRLNEPGLKRHHYVRRILKDRGEGGTKRNPA